jgi:three-Cys-motif partner protein
MERLSLIAKSIRRRNLIPECYRGREQTYIKHKLLQDYLESLFMIIGQSVRQISYVDCFAGPWQEGGKKHEDTSISITLSMIQKIRSGLSKIGKSVTFRALFIERDPIAYEKLNTFLAKDQWDGINITSYCGEFKELRETILEWCGEKDFCFFFIDPTGWKNVVEIKTLYPLLKRPRSEYLINFMYDFLLRAHSQPTFKEHMREVFGFIPDTTGMTPDEKEKYLMALYLQHLKEIQPSSAGTKPRASSVKVLYPTKDRTMYALVYLTRHPKGIVTFNKVSEKVDNAQRLVRADTKQAQRIERTGQWEIFTASTLTDEANGDVKLSEVKEYWLNQLDYKPKRFGEKELADMLEETGWFIGDFQKGFNALIKGGKAQNQDATRNRPVHAVHFEKDLGRGEHLKKVKQ